jgi:hypothetical protein
MRFWRRRLLWRCYGSQANEAGVLVTDRNLGGAWHMAPTIGAEAAELDVREPDQWQSVIDALLTRQGRLDVLDPRLRCAITQGPWRCTAPNKDSPFAATPSILLPSSRPCGLPCWSRARSAHCECRSSLSALKLSVLLSRGVPPTGQANSSTRAGCICTSCPSAGGRYRNSRYRASGRGAER